MRNMRLRHAIRMLRRIRRDNAAGTSSTGYFTPVRPWVERIRAGFATRHEP